jgi:paraquat-inducible protein B
MNDVPPPERAPEPPPSLPADLPLAQVQPRHRVALVWLIPLLAAGIAAFLAWTTLSQRGAMITITFGTGNGLTAGQTAVEHKAVKLGTVESVRLSADMSHVIVQVRMLRSATPVLTDHARFWVVRPRLSAGTISGLETLVSGSYIEIDPGLPGGQPQRDFTGLANPPGVRSDEPGRTFDLLAQRLGSLGPGSPVFYRDVAVGEVLGYETPGTNGPITVHVFIRKPFDQYVHEGTHFWNASGLSVSVGSQGLHVELQSIQAVLSGGVAFGTPPAEFKAPLARAGATFTLYSDLEAAQAAGLSEHIPFVTYFTSSVRGLDVGAPVQMFGIRVGTVDSMKLLFTPAGEARVRVGFDVQPQRVFPANDEPNVKPMTLTERFVAHGLRAELQSDNLLTGRMALALDFVPEAPAATVGREGQAIVVPSQPGGLQNIANTASEILDKLNRVPLDKIAANLNDSLAGLRQTLGGPQLTGLLVSATASVSELQKMIHNLDSGLSPAVQRLPRIAAELQTTVAHANALLGQGGIGAGSQISSSLVRTLDQLDSAARSIRLLADFLARHPEALIRGRSANAP